MLCVQMKSRVSTCMCFGHYVSALRGSFEELSSAGKASRQVPTTPQLSRVSNSPPHMLPHNTTCLPQELVGSSTAVQPANRQQLPAFDINGCALFFAACKPPECVQLWTPLRRPARARTRQKQRERKPAHNPQRCTLAGAQIAGKNSTQLDFNSAQSIISGCHPAWRVSIVEKNQHARQGPACLPACLPHSAPHQQVLPARTSSELPHTHTHPVTTQPCPSHMPPTNPTPACEMLGM
jgi:hypothetical protein